MKCKKEHCILSLILLFLLATITSSPSAGVVRRSSFIPMATLGSEKGIFMEGGGEWFSAVLPESGVVSCPDTLIDYGGFGYCAINYPNARHLVHNHLHGVPVIVYECGSSQDNAVVMTRWNHFGFWEPPITVSSQQVDAGRCGIAGDSQGNIHAAWHQTDDGQLYYVMYALYLWEDRVFTNYTKLSGETAASFPSIVVDGEDNPWIVFCEGEVGGSCEIRVAHSPDYGETWEPLQTVPGGPFSNGWMLPAIDVQEETGTPHVIFNGGDGDEVKALYSFRDPMASTWSPAEVSADSIYCCTIVVGSDGEVHLAGFQGYGWGSSYGNIGVIKYWHGYSGDWSEPEPPFIGQTEEAWMDSFAGYPTLAIDECDNLVMAWAQVDTVVDSAAVSGLYGSYLVDDSCEWHEMMSWTEPDEWDVIYPQLNHKSGYIDESGIPGVGVVWGAMIEAQQPSSVCYMYLGDILPDPCLRNLVPRIDLRAVEIDGGIHISWGGDAALCDLYRARHYPAGFERINERHIRSSYFVDEEVCRGESYYYRLFMMDENGIGTMRSAQVKITVGVGVARTGVTLEPCIPNPFNPVTSIRFSVPGSGLTSLKVFDSAGAVVKTILDRQLPAGTYTKIWDGRTDAGRDAPSGEYFCRLKACGRIETTRMLLLR